MLPPSDDSEHYQLEGMPEDDGEGERYTGGDMEDGEEDDYELESFGNMEQEDQDERPGYQQIEPGIDSDGSVRLQPEKKKKKGKAMNVSESGTEYPPFPKRVIKKLASKAGDKISNETLNALSSYTRLFFEQAAGDLGAYARHAGRKTIEDADALQLLRRYLFLFSILHSFAPVLTSTRQKQINLQTTAFSLAQKHLPRELSQEIRMPVANKVLRKRFRKSE